MRVGSFSIAAFEREPVISPEAGRLMKSALRAG
jgi:hypothetical protein